MANINFPSNPLNGAIYTYGAATYIYDSAIPGWLAYPTLPGGVPAGTIVQWGTATAPANWMICDGTAISRSTYASLFNVIGTTYGAGDGSTTFNLPNLKGRVPIGLDGSQTQFTTLGQTGGNKSLALYGTGTATGYGLTYSGSMNTADDGTASNLQPYVVVNYIIKTSMANTPGDSALATRVGALETFNTTAQPVPVGGTGVGTLASGSYLKGNGTAAIQAQTGLPAGDITSGTLASARLPAGTILQVVSTTSTSNPSTTSGSFVDTGIGISITPRSTSSKIYLSAVFTHGNTIANWNFFAFARNGSVIGISGNGSGRNAGQGGWVTDSGTLWPVALGYLDSPSTTSAVSYNIYWNTWGGTAVIGRRGADLIFATVTTVTAMEVAG